MAKGKKSEDEFAERKRLYERHREELSKRQISNAENLDKSILTYSAAGLALSLGFLKDFIPIAQARVAWALYGSWIFFTFAILAVISSYVVSLQVVNLQLNRAERYYLKNEETACNESCGWDKCAHHLNHWLPAVAFGIALILTTLFVSTNLRISNRAENKMTKIFTQDGVLGLTMQKVAPNTQIVQRGLTGMPMQTVTPSAPANNQGSIQQGQGGTGACQGSCRLTHAAIGWLSRLLLDALTTASRSGLSVTAPMGVQLRVLPDQRRGLRSRAWQYSA